MLLLLFFVVWALVEQGDEAEWKKAIDNAKAQLEHQHLRCVVA